MFTSDFYTNNRKKLIAKLQQSVFAVSANAVLQKSNDDTYAFRQDSNFWYLTGINEPDCILVITGNGHEHLFIPQVTELQQTWLSGGLTLVEARKISGIKNVHYLSEKAAIIKNILSDATEVFIPQPQNDSYFSYELQPAQKKLKRTLKRYGVRKIIDCSQLLAELRVVKSHEEIQQLAQVTQFTENVLNSAKKFFAEPTSESEIYAYITAEFMRAGFKHGYDGIVAGGDRAFRMHYRENSYPIVDNTAVLIDVGAEKNYYSADVTRMLEIGQMSVHYEQIKKIVVGLQEFIVSNIKPGTTPIDVARLYRQELLTVLKKLKLLDESASEKDTLEFCPHGFGHFLGLDIHDVGDYHAPFKENMVFMVEPGLYIKEWYVAVRLEDAYLVESNGCRKLTELLE